jgi:hypothetical protein
MEIQAIIVAYALMAVAVFMLMFGAYVALTSLERGARASWAIAPGIVLLLVGFIIYLSVLIPPTVCAEGSQKVKGIRQFGTDNTMTLCLSDAQISEFFRYRSIVVEEPPAVPPTK